MTNLNIATYRAMIDPDTNTIKSTDLHTLVYAETKKFKLKEAFHKKVVQVLDLKGQSILDGQLVSSIVLNNIGKVAYYNLNEIEANMVMASIDVNHLRLMAEVFVAVKSLAEENEEFLTALAHKLKAQKLQAKIDKSKAKGSKRKSKATKLQAEADLAVSNKESGIKINNNNVQSSEIQLQSTIQRINSVGSKVVNVNVMDKASIALLPTILLGSAMAKSPRWVGDTTAKQVGLMYRVLEGMGYVTEVTHGTFVKKGKVVSKKVGTRKVIGKGLLYGRNTHSHTIKWFEHNSDELVEAAADYFNALPEHDQAILNA